MCVKTIILFMEEPYSLKYLVVEGNYSQLDGVLINTAFDEKDDEELQKKLYELVYDQEKHYLKESLIRKEFPMDEITDSTKIIQAGFI